MRHVLGLLALVLVLMAPVSGARADERHRTLVLVSGTAGGIEKLSNDEVLFLFMDAPVVKGGVRLQPVLNETDPLLREVFLQKVMFMSWRHYQRRLVSQAFSHGWARPETVLNLSALVHKLKTESGTVTYMWKKTAEEQNVKIVQVLWSGYVN
ncbi:MAG TPA: hypothetical protein VKA13_03430 [Gammaproteobacteria bacterium]|nr:hypothetical protein [Gammaproteobacteria bacterium]